MLDNEAASGGLSLTLVPDNILKSLIHGYLFLESGDLISAESALFHVQTALESSEKYEDVRCCIASQTDIAICKLRRGMYKEAQEDFNAVLHKKITVHERNTVERWIAISLLYQGHYEEATECFNSILETIHTKGLDHIITEILVRRNLAL
ncbi:hypothetical protein GGS24DRAFT_508002 [Hypoxylon argillaceum]|nr:hypothetical protein GGS24DRAFT_508002 [Hypoxylon argillaceum]